ncbi:hypothetical protein [Yersinia phage vB_YenM_P778]
MARKTTLAAKALIEIHNNMTKAILDDVKLNNTEKTTALVTANTMVEAFLFPLNCYHGYDMLPHVSLALKAGEYDYISSQHSYYAHFYIVR